MESKTKINVNWGELNKRQKEIVIRNPKLFFILVDIKLSKGKMKGIPKFK